MPKTVSTEEIDAMVDGWFESHFRNNAVARDTAVYNLAVEAGVDLKAKIRALILVEAPAPALIPQSVTTKEGE